MSNIRVARELDTEAIASIYAPFCMESSAVSFEIEPPSIALMRDRIKDTLAVLPWIVYEENGIVSGYAYASKHKARAAYDWSVDVSIYLAATARGKGIGTKLYLHLFEMLRQLGYYNAYAGVTLPNDASIGLHKSLGFKEVGIYQHVGYKSGKWHDVVWLELLLKALTIEPAQPILFPEYIKASLPL